MASRSKRIVRVKAPYVLMHPVHGVPIVPTPADEYTEDDPLVKAFSWAFEADEDREHDDSTVESVPIEQATKAPGEKRRTKSKP